MSNQPIALLLADALEGRVVPRWIHSTGQTSQQSGYRLDAECQKAAAELRRLHMINRELLDALCAIRDANAREDGPKNSHTDSRSGSREWEAAQRSAHQKAAIAIVKATGG